MTTDTIVLATCNQRQYMEGWMGQIQACIHNYRLKEQNFLMRMSMIGGNGYEHNNNSKNIDKSSQNAIKDNREDKKIENVNAIDEQSLHNIPNNFEVNANQTSLFNVPEDNSNDSLQDFKIDKKIGSGSFGKV